MRPILDVAAELGLAPSEVVLFGEHMAKLRHAALPEARAAAAGRLVLVSAINPTRAGEGKTTVAIGLAQGLKRAGASVALALREPSLGPIFGIKGGGTGGGRCQLEPATRINMHFTGDIHAIGAAHNLLAALVDNAIHFRSALDLEQRQIYWRRVMDMNERTLRKTVIGLGGRRNGVPREDGFDITAASEVMAILCLFDDIADLKARLGRILVGLNRSGEPVTASSLDAAGPMAALLYDALLPNLVQTSEGVPAFVHGGPFGNIAHGCNSVMATRAALQRADYVVTEAGFGFDLGAEKFFDIKCRSSGLWPHAVVLVVTARALRIHGGGDPGSAGTDEELARGLEHLDHHVQSVRAFGFEPVIAINCFAGDSEIELSIIEDGCRERKLRCARFTGFAEGGAGAVDLAQIVLEAAAPPPTVRFLYELSAGPSQKIAAVAETIYAADEVTYSRAARRDLEQVGELGFERLPVCIAKTHLALTDDHRELERGASAVLAVESVRVAAGAGYLLALAGDIVTMPGLPRQPAAQRIGLGDDGEVTGVVRKD